MLDILYLTNNYDKYDRASRAGSPSFLATVSLQTHKCFQFHFYVPPPSKIEQLN